MNNSDSPIRFMVKGYECFVDEVDVDLLDCLWHLHARKNRSTIYLRATLSISKKVLIHRLIMSRVLGRHLQRDEQVDHRDGNGLNNSRSNLRIATQSQNNGNRGVQNNNRLGVKGVRAQRGKFVARFRQKHLGTFDTPELAYAAYLETAKKYFGEFAREEK